MFKNFFKELPNMLMNDEKRTRLQYLGVYTLLGTVSVAMTVINIFTHKGELTIATAAFAFLCALDIMFERLGGVWSQVASYIFQVEILSLFSYFIISGNPEGFSCIWIALLPSCGMTLFQIKKGSVLCAIMEAILIFFFWTPLGQSFLHYEYTESFKMRFPVLFIAFYVIGLALEAIRANAFSKYQYQCDHDALTGALNRRGFTEEINLAIKSKNSNLVGFIIADLDFFKNVNDTHGHFAGDIVLEATANALAESTGMNVCRWGGEEFAIFDPIGYIDQEFMDSIVRDFATREIVANGERVPITISMGGVVADTTKYDINEISHEADVCLYEAKENGRNRAVFRALE